MSRDTSKLIGTIEVTITDAGGRHVVLTYPVGQNSGFHPPAIVSSAMMASPPPDVFVRCIVNAAEGGGDGE